MEEKNGGNVTKMFYFCKIKGYYDRTTKIQICMYSHAVAVAMLLDGNAPGGYTPRYLLDCCVGQCCFLSAIQKVYQELKISHRS